jgi:hypothetical protein
MEGGAAPPSVSATTVNVTAWSGVHPYSARCPDGRDWLARIDGRITAVWLAGGEIGFAWSSNRTAARPWPFVRVVRIDEASKAAGTWRLAATRNGTHAPDDGKWGDYLTCRRHSPNGAEWVASGYTLRGGGERTDVEPRFVHFRA